VELAGSLLALVDWLETGAGCKSAVLSSSKPTRPPPLIEWPCWAGLSATRELTGRSKTRNGDDRPSRPISWTSTSPLGPDWHFLAADHGGPWGQWAILPGVQHVLRDRSKKPHQATVAAVAFRYGLAAVTTAERSF
jgi:hypothetical protein